MRQNYSINNINVWIWTLQCVTAYILAKGFVMQVVLKWANNITLAFHIWLQVDITYYPYDRQKCGIEVVSWGYTKDEVNLGRLYNEINLEDFVYVCIIFQYTVTPPKTTSMYDHVITTTFSHTCFLVLSPCFNLVMRPPQY